MASQYPTAAFKRRNRRHEVIAERAVRVSRLSADAEAARAAHRWRFLGWLFARLLAFAVVLGTAWVVYDSASSDRFQVREVRVRGNLLANEDEVRRLSGVGGANVFWIDRRVVEVRLRGIAAIERVEVAPILPDSVEIRVVEKRPVAFWENSGTTYLVDRGGTVLAPVAMEADPNSAPRACSGMPCDPRVATNLPYVQQTDGEPLSLGAKVDAGALVNSAKLADRLVESGVHPVAIQWSRDFGLEVPTREGWRVRFGTKLDVDWQLTAVQTIRDYLDRSKQSAQVIDVRFADRPFFR